MKRWDHPTFDVLRVSLVLPLSSQRQSLLQQRKQPDPETSVRSGRTGFFLMFTVRLASHSLSRTVCIS